MKKAILKSILVSSVMFCMASNLFAADIPNPANQKTGAIWRHETASGINELLEPENGVYGLHTFAVDANDWDSQFFIVFADKPVAVGTHISIKFEYRKDGEGAVIFNAQGHADPHAYVNNDGWETLECTDTWQKYEGSFAASGEIRTLGVNASIARENGTLYMRNIVVEVDGDEVIVTKETDANAAEIEEAPEIKEPKPITTTDFKTYFSKVKTSDDDLANSYFVANNQGDYYVPMTVQFDDGKVFAFEVDSTCETPQNVQFFAYWMTLEQKQEQVSPSVPAEAIISFDYWYDWEGGTAGNICQDSYVGDNQIRRYGALSLAQDADGKAIHFKNGRPAWRHYADTIKNDMRYWELHLGATKPKYSYTAFLKNVEVKVNGEVVASSNNSTISGIKVYYRDETSVEIDGLKYSYQGKNNYKLIGYTNRRMKNVVIPNSIKIDGVDYPVVRISSGAFKDHTKLESVYIPASVKTIEDDAFNGCTNLTTVFIPYQDYYSIGENAFKGCKNLSSVYIPKSTTSIGENAFEDVKSIIYSGDKKDTRQWGAQKVIIPDKESKTLVMINDHKLLRYIGTDKNVDIRSIKEICDNAFDGCNTVEKVTFTGNSVTRIGNYAFRNCANLKKNSHTQHSYEHWRLGICRMQTGNNMDS